MCGVCFSSGQSDYRKMALIEDSMQIHWAYPGYVFDNKDDFKEGDPLREISVEDYVGWVLGKLKEYQKNPPIFDKAVNTLVLLAGRSFPPKISDSLFQWMTTYNGEKWSVILRSCAIIFSKKHMDPKQDDPEDDKRVMAICQACISTMNWATQRSDALGLPWTDLYYVTMSPAHDKMCVCLASDEGIQLLTWAFQQYKSQAGTYRTHQNMATVFSLCGSVMDCGTHAKKMASSTAFLTHVDSFLPASLKAAGVGVQYGDIWQEYLQPAEGRTLAQYSDLLIKLSVSQEFLDKFMELDFLGDFKEAIEILKKSEWKERRVPFTIIILATLFAVCSFIKDPKIVKDKLIKNVQKEIKELPSYSKTKEQFWFKDCLDRASESINKFITQWKSATEPEMQAAVTLAEGFIALCEKEKDRYGGSGTVSTSASKYRNTIEVGDYSYQKTPDRKEWIRIKIKRQDMRS